MRRQASHHESVTQVTQTSQDTRTPRHPGTTQYIPVLSKTQLKTKRSTAIADPRAPMLPAADIRAGAALYQTQHSEKHMPGCASPPFPNIAPGIAWYHAQKMTSAGQPSAPACSPRLHTSALHRTQMTAACMAVPSRHSIDCMACWFSTRQQYNGLCQKESCNKQHSQIPPLARCVSSRRL
jgi:hypothetical protein